MNDTEPDFQMTLAALNGGPYDDEAMLCGWTMGILDTHLMYAPNSLQILVLASWVTQADLIAMRRGYTSKVIGRDNGDWMIVQFHPAAAELEADCD